MAGKEVVLRTVQDRYAGVARSELSGDTEAIRAVAAAFGYAPEDLASLPPQANMGLSCGNPVAIAALRDGEVVLDLGCGGGIDVLLAARRVGDTGRAIGVDMTPEMISRAKAAAEQAGAANAEFHLAEIDRLPLPDASVDCVISNCVINLVPDKPRAFGEILRVLRPGGRLAISDIALKRPLPEEIRDDMQAYVGCISGALMIDEYEQLLRQAGFRDVVVQDAGADLNAYAQAAEGGCCSADASCCGGEGSDNEIASDNVVALHEVVALHDGLANVLGRFDANEYAASVRVHAIREGAATRPAGDRPDAAVAAADLQAPPNLRGDDAMKTIRVYDKPMCCPTGICGPEVDPVLPRFAADLDWLKGQGHDVERFNLAQQPRAFAENERVRALLAEKGVDVLPVVEVDGRIVSRRGYPTREMMSLWTKAPTATHG